MDESTKIIDALAKAYVQGWFDCADQSRYLAEEINPKVRGIAEEFGLVEEKPE